MYCATKWAVEAFLQGLRQETAGSNIRVCSIQPGATESELATHIKDPDVLAGGKYVPELANYTQYLVLDSSPFKNVRILGAEDVANAVLYTLSQPAYVSTNEGLCSNFKFCLQSDVIRSSDPANCSAAIGRDAQRSCAMAARDARKKINRADVQARAFQIGTAPNRRTGSSKYGVRISPE